MRLSTRIARIRETVAWQLYNVAQPNFKYPKNVRSRWHLPNVLEWEPWEGEIIDAHTEQLWGAYILPSVVAFPVPDTEKADVSRLRTDLRRMTDAYWYADDRDFSIGVVIATRMSKEIRHLDETTQTVSTLHVPWDFPTPEGWIDQHEWEARYSA